MWTILFLLIAGLPVARCPAQTTVNPDISAIGDTRLVIRDDNSRLISGAARTSFRLEELELAFTGYLNPYARSDVYVSFDPAENSVEVEEASATILRGLPWSLQFKFGKYLLDMGKINTQHPHQWAWLDVPLMLQKFLGEEGARVTGANLSILKAIGDNALTVSFNVFDDRLFAESAVGSTSTGSSHTGSNVALSGRVSIFRSLTDYTSLETGVSFLHGDYEPVAGLSADMAAFDMKLKWRPDMYRTAVFIMEGMLSSRELPQRLRSSGDRNRASGFFTACDIKWRRLFDGGMFFDYAGEALESAKDTRAFGAFFGFMPAEETTRFSIVWRREVSDLYDGSDNSVTFQVLWSLGPHKPHPF
jgi:hypothetical protein